MNTPTFFISGHLDFTEDEFRQHYVPEIDKALAQRPQVWFVVGDARGADTMAIAYLKERDANIVVFHMLKEPRTKAMGIAVSGGYTSDAARDAAMTAASTHDICWIRPGREKSGTAKNLTRRSTIVEVSITLKDYFKFDETLEALRLEGFHATRQLRSIAVLTGRVAQERFWLLCKVPNVEEVGVQRAAEAL